MHDLVSLILAVIGFVVLCAVVYNIYDGFRSGITGTQPRASKAVDDPTKLSNRTAGIGWALVLLFGVFGFAFFVKLLGS